MPPPSSPPLASGLLGLGSSPAQTPPILYPGNFRHPPATTTLPMDCSPPSDETDESSLLARLDQKRREIEAEIEVFRAAKEAEYRELERELREKQKAQSNKKRKRENGGVNNVGGGGADATHATAGATSSDDEGTGKGHKAGSINYGALGLGGSKPNDMLKLEFPDCQKQIGFDGNSVSSVSSSCTTTSPPFEKELQAAGLFTPRYLPLLDDNYFRQTSPTFVLPQDPSTRKTQTSPQQVMPKLANIPSPSSRAGDTSPAYPLASSLKSSSGSSTSTMSKSEAMKQKSPKRVTFQFEDEDSVPSRSSPPPTKVHWTLEGTLEEDDGFVEYEGEEADEDELDEKGKAEHVEHATVEATVGGRFPGDDLIVPTAIGSGNPSVVQSGSGFNGLGISGMSNPTDGTNGNKGGSASDDEPNGYDDDDDDGEVALFDLDETIPEVEDDPAPTRDYSALTNSPQAVTNARLTASSFPMLPSFTPSVPHVPASASESILTFGKSPGPRPGLPRIRRGSLSSSLSPLAKQSQFQQEPIASSLPNFGWKGSDPPKTGFVPTPGGRFRRRSIVKYDLSEDDVVSLKGKGKEAQRAISEASDEDDDDTTFPLSGSPNATSLPMSISRLSPAAFATISNAARPRKPPPKPVVNNDIRDSTPVTGRPSPKLRSPLSGAASFAIQPMVPKVDSADILASMPSSFTTADDASPEKNDSVSSYRRSSPFPSAYDRTPYRTAYAAEVAAAAALDDKADYGGALESVVGGVDGRTGLDPDVSSFSYRASSLGPGGESRGRSGSLVGVEAVNPGTMSFGMRMAWETGKKEEGKRK